MALSFILLYIGYFCTPFFTLTLKISLRMSTQSFFEKLQLKDERNLLIQGLPSTVEKQFVKISFSKNVTPLLKTRKIDFALVFAICHKQLTDILKEVIPAMHSQGKLWIAYPKVSS